MLDSHPDGEKLSVKIDYEMSKDGTRYIFYLENVSPEKKFAEMKRDSLEADIALESALNDTGQGSDFSDGSHRQYD